MTTLRVVIALVALAGCAGPRSRTIWFVKNGLQIKPDDATSWKCVEIGLDPDGAVRWRIGTDASPQWGCPHPWAKRSE